MVRARRRSRRAVRRHGRRAADGRGRAVRHRHAQPRRRRRRLVPRRARGSRGGRAVDQRAVGRVSGPTTRAEPGPARRAGLCGHLVTPERGPALRQRGRRRQPQRDLSRRQLLHTDDVPAVHGYPVLEMLPLFAASSDQPGVFAPSEAAPPRCIGSAQFTAEIKGHDRLAILYGAQRAGECWRDSGERFYQYYADTCDNFEFQGFQSTRARSPATRPSCSRRSSTSTAPRTRPCTSPSRRRTAPLSSRRSRRPAWTPRSTRPTGATTKPYSACPRRRRRHRDTRLHRGSARAVQRIHPVRAGRARSSDRSSRTGDLGVVADAAMFSTVMFAYQVANDVTAEGGDLDAGCVPGGRGSRRQLPRRGLPADLLRQQHRRVRVDLQPPRRPTPLWDGESYTPDPDLPDGYIDTTELLVAVERANPRQLTPDLRRTDAVRSVCDAPHRSPTVREGSDARWNVNRSLAPLLGIGGGAVYAMLGDRHCDRLQGLWRHQLRSGRLRHVRGVRL